MNSKRWALLTVSILAILAVVWAVSYGIYRVTGSRPLFWAAFYVLVPAITAGVVAIAGRHQPERQLLPFSRLFCIGYIVTGAAAVAGAAGAAPWSDLGIVAGALAMIAGRPRADAGPSDQVSGWTSS